MKASGLDGGDKGLGKAMAHKMVYAMQAQHIWGKVEDAGGGKVREFWGLSLKKFRIRPKFHTTTGSAY